MIVVMNSKDASWLSAALDGEGTISFRGYGISLMVANSCREFVERAAEIMGGMVVGPQIDKRAGNRRPMYSAQLHKHQKVLSVLRCILPYLIVKKQKAERAIIALEKHDWDVNFQLSSERTVNRNVDINTRFSPKYWCGEYDFDLTGHPIWSGRRLYK